MPDSDWPDPSPVYVGVDTPAATGDWSPLTENPYDEGLARLSGTMLRTIIRRAARILVDRRLQLARGLQEQEDREA